MGLSILLCFGCSQQSYVPTSLVDIHVELEQVETLLQGAVVIEHQCARHEWGPNFSPEYLVFRIVNPGEYDVSFQKPKKTPPGKHDPTDFHISVQNPATISKHTNHTLLFYLPCR